MFTSRHREGAGRCQVHELSIAYSIVRTVSQAAEEAGEQKVLEVRLRVGALAGVMKESLLFCYDIATQDTPLAGSKLVVNDVPVVIYCEQCGQQRELPSIQLFRCPVCNTPTGEIRQGRELEIESMILEDTASDEHAHT
jgi:hydrogenase nickel incorporation protein HypA/HybF